MEDNTADVFLIREAIEAAGVDADVHVVHDGHQATEFFDTSDTSEDAPCPDLVLLDLNLPKKSGEDVLRHMRGSETCKDALVLIVTSSDSATELNAMTALGASASFKKSSDYVEYLKLGPVVRDLLAGKP